MALSRSKATPSLSVELLLAVSLEANVSNCIDRFAKREELQSAASTHWACIVTAAYHLCGPGGAFHGMVTRQLPEDLDLTLLQPLLPAGVSLPYSPAAVAPRT